MNGIAWWTAAVWAASTGAPGVRGVLDVPGVRGVPDVPGVRGVPDVPGVLTVSVTRASSVSWRAGAIPSEVIAGVYRVP
ncbi:MAG TPA: hypothetical protein VGL92_06895 [Acidimicrobiia bacterium]